jgi:outer membrane protein OmpA-like peptidoglycan-associated protein
MEGLSIWLALSIALSFLATKSPPEPVQQPVQQLAPQPPSPLKETVVLLPEADGKTSGIVIKAGDQEATVTEPFHGVELTSGKIADKTLSAAEVQQLYPDVMQALPEKPRSFILRFEKNGTKLTADSLAIMENIQQEIARRAAPEITVIGHADRVGSNEVNLRLSEERAAYVRATMVSGGIPAEIIQIIWRGELEPEVMTEDGIAEPRNRRAEITVR